MAKTISSAFSVYDHDDTLIRIGQKEMIHVHVRVLSRKTSLVGMFLMIVGMIVENVTIPPPPQGSVVVQLLTLWGLLLIEYSLTV